MIYPLELKTGKSYEGSIEHQAQVLLYSLLLSERWNKGKIVPGFLLYLKDNRIRKIQPKVYFCSSIR
jgi:CRISPR/Cas system-associated exonuclease Cas4 (RecB family)